MENKRKLIRYRWLSLTDKERMSYSASPYRHSLIDLIGLDIRRGRILLVGYKRDKTRESMMGKG